MKHFCIVIVALLFGLVATTHAQTSPTAHALLWKIESPAFPRPSYLFGTFHLLNSDYIDSLAPLWKAFDSTECVIGEIDMKDVDMTSIISTAMMDSLKLADLMSAADYALLDSIFTAKLGFPLTMLQSVKPAAASALLEAAPYLGKNSKDTGADAEAMDIYFQSRARKLDRRVFGLETASEQCHILFDSVSVKEQARELVEMLHTLAHDTSSGFDLEHCYDTEDLPCIAKSENDGTMTPRELQLLITDRNNRWIPKLATLINTRPCFIAVGAGHLVGEEGLISLLQNEGFQLSPIRVHQAMNSHPMKH